MKSKTEITQEYLEMIQRIDLNIEAYEDYLKGKYEQVTSLNWGHRGLEEIIDEIERMQDIVDSLYIENESTKMAIRQNELFFQV